ncbi:MAG TPA: HAMP domain-containing sensor histidine kinase, partial [Phototrophicaceae bacterium]|nr:HAMP domain-containing sensor histidine kinase [Phototrophicaceae bacterium]
QFQGLLLVFFALGNVLKHGHDGAFAPTESKFVRADGVTIDVQVASIAFVYGGERAIMSVFEDITERKKNQQQALELAVERERLRLLGDFIQYASHEFRTPLSIISNSLYLMPKVETPERRQEHENNVIQQIRRITDLLDDMLLMAKLDGSAPLQRAALSLNHLLSAVTTAVHHLPGYEGRELVLELADNLPIIQGNESLLYRAFGNLINRALHHPPDGGVVTVRVYLEDANVLIEVQDSSDGLDTESLLDSFHLFSPTDQSLATPGFGLGLPIARQIITAHKGQIEAIRYAGQGNLFRVVLPMTG